MFPTLDLYPSGVGEVIAIVSADPKFDREVLATRAAALQEQYKFRFPLPERAQAAHGEPASARRRAA